MWIRRSPVQAGAAVPSAKGGIPQPHASIIGGRQPQAPLLNAPFVTAAPQTHAARAVEGRIPPTPPASLLIGSWRCARIRLCCGGARLHPIEQRERGIDASAHRLLRVAAHGEARVPAADHEGAAAAIAHATHAVPHATHVISHAASHGMHRTGTIAPGVAVTAVCAVAHCTVAHVATILAPLSAVRPIVVPPAATVAIIGHILGQGRPRCKGKKSSNDQWSAHR
ncbi:hypothetical protein CHELA40_13182 [Chelatococcus asaccharovorans]|nr:hypothetical protein CHELA40_13182 [Chelatococcus asaccharovorans]CAH1679815.1 hypothetical protein CHELA17_62438 [Chelatococcus asaccharovorans]